MQLNLRQEFLNLLCDHGTRLEVEAFHLIFEWASVYLTDVYDVAQTCSMVKQHRKRMRITSI